MILRFPIGLPLTPAHNALRSVLLGLADKDRLIFAALYDGGDNRVFTLEYDEKIRESGNAGKTDAEKKAGRKKIKEALQDEKEAGRDKSETKDDEISENTELSEIGQENPEAEAPQNAFLYGVLMEAAGFLPISTPVKQWIKKHVDFYLSCAIVEEDVSDFVYTDVKAVDYESGFTTFDAINKAIREKTGTGLDEEDYQKISYVNDINRTNEEVLYETVAGGNGANGSFSYRYGLQRENYSYEGVTTTSGYTAFDAVKTGQTGTYYYDGYGSVSNLAAGKDSLSYVYDAYGNIQKLGMYKDVSTDSAAYASPYGYNGEYSHALSGLQYLRARYYNAESGSFISKDSYAGNIRSILSANRYTYGENNPLGYADPSGHSVLSKLKSAVSSAVNTVRQTVSKAVGTVKNVVNRAITAITNRASIAANYASNALSTVSSRAEQAVTNDIAQKKAKMSVLKADIVSTSYSAYKSVTSSASRLYEKMAAGISQTTEAFGEGICIASNQLHELERKACKAFESCKNGVQEKIKSMDLQRIVNGTVLIVGGVGKITGAIALAVISAPFCATGIGIGGEIAAGIVAASGGGDIAEGIQELIYGYQGDSESKSFNLVRDTLYSGDEKAYEISTGIAAACGDIGMALVKKAAAKTAQKAAEKAFEKELAEQMAKESKEVVEEVVKKNADDVIEEAVGQNADDILEETEKLYDDVFDQYYKEQFDPIGEKAIAQPDSVGYKGGSGTINNVSKASPFDLQATHSQTHSKKNMNKLIEDIKNNGINEPIKYVEYNGQKYVVDGHHRLIAAKRLGLEQVPIEQVELPYAGYETIEDLLWFD